MIEFTPAIRYALLLVRPGMLITVAPVFGAGFAPAQVRIGLVMLLAFTLLPLIAVPASLSLTVLTLAVARETAIGLALGLAIKALVTGAEFAGHLAGYQLGLSYGSIVDPANGVRNNVVAALYGNLAVLVLFATDGHHALIRAMAQSYQYMPVGTGGVDASLVRSVTDMLGIVFVLGVRLALPVVVALLVVELAMGLLSRAAPMLNLMVVSTPVRLVVGLIVVAAVVPIAPQLIARFATLALEVGARTARAFR